jgi:hypothetical protein
MTNINLDLDFRPTDARINWVEDRLEGLLNAQVQS